MASRKAKARRKPARRSSAARDDLSQLREKLSRVVERGKARTEKRRAAPKIEKLRAKIAKARKRAAKPKTDLTLKALRGRRYTTPQALAALHRELSWRRIAKIVQLSQTQLAKLRKGVEPGLKDQRIVLAIKAVHATFDQIRKERTREAGAKRKVGFVSRGSRVMRRDPKAPDKMIPSDSIDFNVMRASDNAILNTLRRYRDRTSLAAVGGAVRFLVLRDEASPDYPGEYAWTDWEGGLSGMTDDDIGDLLAEARGMGTLIAVRVIDK